MRDLRFNTMLASLALVLTTTFTTGCESGQELPACFVDTDTSDDDPGTAYYASSYGGDSATAIAACDAAAADQDGEVSVPVEDDGTAPDVPEEGEEDSASGAITVSLEVEGVILTWVSNDGVQICIEKGRMSGDVSPDNTWNSGYGDGGDYDWTSRAYSADQYRFQDVLYVCQVTPLQPIDDNGLFVKNFNHGMTGVSDYTNWARVFAGDKYACVTGQTSDGAPTFALAYTIQYDREDYWRVQPDTSGACQAVTDG